MQLLLFIVCFTLLPKSLSHRLKMLDKHRTRKHTTKDSAPLQKQLTCLRKKSVIPK